MNEDQQSRLAEILIMARYGFKKSLFKRGKRPPVVQEYTAKTIAARRAKTAKGRKTSSVTRQGDAPDNANTGNPTILAPRPEPVQRRATHCPSSTQ